MEGPSGSVSRKLDLIAGCGRRYPVSPRLGVVGDALCRAPLFAGVLAAPLEDTSSRRCGLPSCEIMDGACRLTGLLQPRQQRKSKNNLKRIGNGNLELRE